MIVTGVADGELPRQLDRERVHRDGADRPAALAGDATPRCRSGRGGSRPHSRRGRARSRCDARRRSAGRSRCSRPAQSASPGRGGSRQPRTRLEPVLRRIRPERREAVQRDAAAGRVEAGLGDAQRGRAVRGVAGELRVAVGRLAEALELAAGEDGVGVGRRQVASSGRRRPRLAAGAPRGRSGPSRCRASGGRGRPRGSRRRRRRARAGPRGRWPTSRFASRAHDEDARRRGTRRRSAIPSGTVTTQSAAAPASSAAPATSRAPCP